MGIPQTIGGSRTLMKEAPQHLGWDWLALVVDFELYPVGNPDRAHADAGVRWAAATGRKIPTLVGLQGMARLGGLRGPSRSAP